LKPSPLRTGIISIVFVIALGCQLTTNSPAKAATDARNEPAPIQIVPRKIVDLTHSLAPGIPDFHGDSNAFEYKKLFTVQKDGYANGSFTMPEHLGTHVDAPSHFYDGKQSIDQIPAQKLIVPCVVLDVREEVKRDPDYRLTVEKINSFEQAGKIPSDCAVLLLTGWSERWSNPTSYRNVDAKGVMHFPGFGGASADFLVNQRHVAALGIDTLSTDAGSSDVYPVHKLVLASGTYMIENLDRLADLPARNALLFCGPLRIKDGTGSPARILAVVPE
jgi:kynurenine formamidase